MLSLLRRVPVRGADGSVAGRELGGATIGLVGMPPSARTIAQLLGALRRRASSATTRRCMRATRRGRAGRSAPPACASCVEQSDVRLRPARLLQPLPRPARRPLPVATASPNQVRRQHRPFGPVRRGRRWPTALKSGRIAAAWLDSVEPGALDAGRPLHGIETLQVTPRVASDDARVAPAQRLGGGAPDRRAATSAPTSAPAELQADVRQARSLISQPSHCRREVGDARFLLIDHRGRRAGDEALVAELGRRPSRSRRRAARSPWPGARRLGGARRSRRAARAASRRRRRPVNRCVASANAASSSNSVTSESARERLQQRRRLAHELGVADRRCSGTRSPGDRLHLAAQVAAAADDRLQLRDPRVGLRRRRARAAPSDRARGRCRARCRRLAAGDGGDALPQLGGDERRDRVQQPQHRLEDAQQRSPRRALLGLVARLQLHLGDLEVPVAVLVPDERVDRLATLSSRYSAKPFSTAASTRCSSPVIQRSAGEKRQVVVERLARARTRPWCARRGRSPRPRSSSARSGSRSRACCRSCGSPRSASRRS